MLNGIKAKPLRGASGSPDPVSARRPRYRVGREAYQGRGSPPWASSGKQISTNLGDVSIDYRRGTSEIYHL